jgi:hypothetical protein
VEGLAAGGPKLPAAAVAAIVVVPNVALAVFARMALEPTGGWGWLAFIWLLANGAAIEHFLWAPNRVTLDDDGVELISVARHVRIARDDLEAVGPSPWTIRRGEFYQWRRSGGWPISTRPAVDMHRLLAQIEQRAPHSAISS